MERDDIVALTQLDSTETKSLASLLAKRRSCRKFLPEPVPSEIIERIFSVAQLSASWCNAQPWQVIVTRGDGTEQFREMLYQIASDDALNANQPDLRNSEQRRSDLPMPREYTGLRKERRRSAGTQLYKAVGVMGDRQGSARYTLENFRFFDAPHAAIFTSAKELGAYGVLDVGGYLSALTLVMQSFGIASITQAALALYGDVIHEFFGISQDQLVICGMSFGYSDNSHPSNSFNTNRAPLAEVVTWYD